jgi:hypothetical protein
VVRRLLVGLGWAQRQNHSTLAKGVMLGGGLQHAVDAGVDLYVAVQQLRCHTKRSVFGSAGRREHGTEVVVVILIVVEVVCMLGLLVRPVDADTIAGCLRRDAGTAAIVDLVFMVRGVEAILLVLAQLLLALEGLVQVAIIAIEGLDIVSRLLSLILADDEASVPVDSESVEHAADLRFKLFSDLILCCAFG